jgi:Flp pilus assembly protein protease CpaA
MAGAELLLVSVWALTLSVCDLRWRILPNWLTLGGAAVVLLLRFVTGGTAGFTDSLAAGAVAGAFLFLPFLLRGAGGGDVKMLFTAGAIAGWSRVLFLLWYMSLAGLVLAVVMLALNQVESHRLKHYLRCAVDWRYDRKAGAAALPPKESTKARVPFALAISAGLILAMLVSPR